MGFSEWVLQMLSIRRAMPGPEHLLWKGEEQSRLQIFWRLPPGGQCLMSLLMFYCSILELEESTWLSRTVSLMYHGIHLLMPVFPFLATFS